MKKTNSSRPFLGKFFTAVSVALLAAATARADYQSTVLADSPLAFYALNPGSDPSGTSPDLTGNGNTGDAFNLVPMPGPSAFITNAAGLDGQFAYVDLDLIATNPGLLDFGGPIAIEGWAQPTSATMGLQDIMAKGYDSSQTDDEITLRANGGNYFGGTFNDSNGTRGASGGVQSTNWAYVVIVNDGTNWIMYVNGQPTQTNADTVGVINFVDPWRIGNGSASGAGRLFQGNLSEVALYNHALTASQVLTHFFIGEVNTLPGNSVPIILTQPQPQSTFTGGSVTFSVSAVSALPVTYQWFRNSTMLTGKTNSSVTISGVTGADALNYSVAVHNSNGTTNSASVALTLLAAGNSLRWSAASSGTWDTGISANWINITNGQTVTFNTNDQVLFDDTVGAPTNVTTSGSVAPSVLTVNSSTNNFAFTGSGGVITGSGSLVKKGSSLLSFLSSANFTGPVNISGGTVYAGDFAFTSVASITVTNGGTLDFGGGTLSDDKPVTVSGAGVGGGGALVNSSFDIYDNVFNITLLGNTTFGGTGRWDLGNGSAINGPFKVTINRASGVYGEWDTVALATNVGDIEIDGGKLGLKGMGNSIGNSNTTIIVGSGTELDFYDSNFGANSGYNKNIHVLNNGTFQVLTGNNSFLNANVTLEDSAHGNMFNGSGSQTMNGTYTLNGIAHLLIGDSTVIFTNVIGGSGGFVWDAYNHNLTFLAANTYTGPTVIGSGLTLVLSGNGSISHSTNIFFGGSTTTNDSLDVSGRSDQTLTLASGQTLGGVGSVNGALTVSAGAAIAPAGTNVILGMTEGNSVVGTLAASGAVKLNGTTIIKLNGSGVNDVVGSASSITYGGTLNLVNISGAPYAAGNSFQIFSAASYGGNFTGGLVPPTPGAGLAWDTSQLNIGFLNVIAGSTSPSISTHSVVNGNLIFGGSGGPANGNYVVLTTTNATTVLANWTPVITNSFDGSGNFSATNAIGTGQHYYAIKLLP